LIENKNHADLAKFVEEISRMIAAQLVGLFIHYTEIDPYILSMKSQFEKFIMNVENKIFIAKLIVKILYYLPLKIRVSLGCEIFLRNNIIKKNFHQLFVIHSSKREIIMLHELSHYCLNMEWDFDQLLADSTSDLSFEKIKVNNQQTISSGASSILNIATTSLNILHTIPVDIFEEDNIEEEKVKKRMRTNENNRTYVQSLEEAHEVYNSIHDKFGLNTKVDINEETQTTINNLQDLAKRSIKHLSSDLYSEDIHSILELTQNSDDNMNSPGIIPKFSLTLTESNDNVDCPFTLEFINNEIGFSQENVKAICDIAKSTKSIKDPGYIGNKGIGFKSVFKLTDTPQIHSNYFNFQFDCRGDVLGYIIPKPINPPDDWNPNIDRTKIVLPLSMKEEVKSHELFLQSICENLNEISPSILLFLHRIKCLELTINSALGSKITGWKRRYYRRVDQFHQSLVKISVKEESNIISNGSENNIIEKEISWLVLQHRFEVLSSEATVTTEISIAFRLDYILSFQSQYNNKFGNGLSIQNFPENWFKSARIYQQFRNLEPHHVYAFLPLRSYGFRFTLQGDWKVTSSREAVDSANIWNIMLRDEIPDAFAKAILKLIEYSTNLNETKNQILEEKIYSDSDSSDMDEVNDNFSEDCVLCLNLIFHLIPSNQVVEFFSSVPKNIFKRLSSLQFIPTIENTFEFPNNVFLHPYNNKAIGLNSFEGLNLNQTKAMELDLVNINITSKLLKKYSNLTCTHPFVIIPHQVVVELNLKQLSFSLFLPILKNWEEIKSKKYANNYLVWILEQLYAFLDTSLIEKLKKLPIFLLRNGKMTSLENKILYYYNTNDQLYDEYADIVNDYVLDYDFAIKLQSSQDACILFRHCCQLFEELSEHNIMRDIVVSKFIGKIYFLLILIFKVSYANFLDPVNVLNSTQSNTRYISLFEDLVQHKCDQCKGDIGKVLSEKSILVVVANRNDIRQFKFENFSNSIKRTKFQYNLQMMKEALDTKSIIKDNDLFEKAMKYSKNVEDIWEVHPDYNSKIVLKIFKNLNLLPFFTLQEKNIEISNEIEFKQYFSHHNDRDLSELEFPLTVIDYFSDQLNFYISKLSLQNQNDFCSLLDCFWNDYESFRYKKVIWNENQTTFNNQSDNSTWFNLLCDTKWILNPKNEKMEPKELFIEEKVSGVLGDLVLYSPKYEFFQGMLNNFNELIEMNYCL
jgi:hypothetical protein